MGSPESDPRGEITAELRKAVNFALWHDEDITWLEVDLLIFQFEYAGAADDYVYFILSVRCLIIVVFGREELKRKIVLLEFLDVPHPMRPFCGRGER